MVKTVVEKDTIRKELMEQINNTLKKLNKENLTVRGMKKEQRMCVAVIGVAMNRVATRVWTHKTAAQQLRKMKAWMEFRYPGISELPCWRHAHTMFKSVGHEVNKAPFLTMNQIRTILESFDIDKHRALFWMALLTCSRIGNLKGWTVKKKYGEALRVLPIQQKSTGSKANGHTELDLYYWNEEMKESIGDHLPIGRILEEDVTAVEQKLRTMRVRKHSIRRTAVQTYMDCGTPTENIRAITGHADCKTVYEYVGRFAPIQDRSRPAGMAISHAPLIWTIQNTENVDLLKAVKSGTSMPQKLKSQRPNSRTK